MTKAQKRQFERLDETEKSIKEFDANIVARIVKQKSKLKACPSCESKINVKYVTKVACMCCGSNNFGYTDTDKKKLERLKEVRAEIKKSLKGVERVETVKATSTKKVISKPVEEVEPSRWTAYITEYGADGSAEDSFKEWFYWEGSGKPSAQDAADELGYPVHDIQMIVPN